MTFWKSLRGKTFFQEEKMIHWVLTGAVAGGAFILSLIIGFLSGISAGTVFLRALGGGFLFALLVAVIRFIINRFLPELMEPMESSKEEPSLKDGSLEDSEGRGEHIDIVLDGEDNTSEANDGDAAGSGDVGPQEEDLDDYLAEEPPEEGEDESALEGDGTSISASAEELEDMEELDESGEALPESADSASLEEEGISGISSFNDEFDGPSKLSLVEDKFLDPTTSIQALGATHDTEEMARAVQSVLQKDQEG